MEMVEYEPSDEDRQHPKVTMKIGSQDSVNSLRAIDLNFQTSEDIVEHHSLSIYFSNRKSAVLGGWLGIARTLFVCIILTISILRLSKYSETLVLNPLEDMVRKINKISKNPLQAAEMEESEFLEMNELKTQNKKKWLKLQEQFLYEPAILEKIVIKIGMLLAIGFGEAGSNIIAQNMALSGSVNPMLEGNKMVAIFGFCDIRKFAEITDILKADILPFVNKVAKIVHSIVNLHQGAANKNIGEAFLLVWKIPLLTTHTKELIFGNDILEQMDGHQATILGDLSVIAFLKVIAAVNKSKQLAHFSMRDDVIAKFGEEGSRITMGFGLHLGWAIEGAIGSNFKIDASYLSPNVNMAARLQAATRQFGVHVLISGVLMKYLSPALKTQLRHIDTVTVKGSIQPISKIYLLQNSTLVIWM